MQVNVGRGSGAWEGDFYNTEAGGTLLAGSAYKSPGRDWVGVSFGIAAGLPSVNANTTNFVHLLGHSELYIPKLNSLNTPP